MDFVVSDTPVIFGEKPKVTYDFFSFIRYTLIIIILAFLGINFFTVLGKTLDITGNALKQTVNVSADGTKDIIDVAKTVSTSTIDTVSDVANKGIQNLQKSDKNIHDELSNIKPHESEKDGESGYCFIGEDNGFRSCISVTDSDTCVSNKIFPTYDKCMNPELR